MRKRIAILLAMVMLLSLCACGESAGTAQTKSATITDTSGEQTTGESAETSETPDEQPDSREVDNPEETLLTTAEIMEDEVEDGSFEAYVLAFEYNKALSAYYDQIAGNAQKEADATEFLREYLFGSLDDYAAGLISDKDFETVETTLRRINDSLSIITDNLNVADGQYSRVSYSKLNYSLGMEYFEDAKYADAVMKLEQVDILDIENYDRAQERIDEAKSLYYDQTIEQANTYLSNMHMIIYSHI